MKRVPFLLLILAVAVGARFGRAQDLPTKKGAERLDIVPDLLLQDLPPVAGPDGFLPHERATDADVARASAALERAQKRRRTGNGFASRAWSPLQKRRTRNLPP